MRQYILEKCHTCTNVGLGSANKIQKGNSKPTLFITKRHWSKSEEKVIIISKADLGLYYNVLNLHYCKGCY